MTTTTTTPKATTTPMMTTMEEVGEGEQLERNVRNKTIPRITDEWINKWGTYLQDNNATELPLEAYGITDISFFASFAISKSKPWRMDDARSIALNHHAEIIIDPDGKQGEKPKIQPRDSPAWKLLNQKGCGEADVRAARIVNGKDAQEGAYPWMVALLKSGDAWCGGSILNENWILTAGHCFMHDVNPKMYAIRVGTIDRNRGQAYKVDRVIIHGRFHLDNQFNSDIALLHVSKPIKMSRFVKPVCLPKKHLEEPKTSKLLVIGWGQLGFENRDLPTILQEVVLSQIKLLECAKKYKKKGNKIYHSQICTWNKGQDACQGDSGSPAVEYQEEVATQIGIVSYGSTCADEMPGVYTKVSFYLDWILRVLEREELKLKEKDEATGGGDDQSDEKSEANDE